MKIGRFLFAGRKKWGILKENMIHFIIWKNKIGGDFIFSGEKVSLEEVKLLSPCRPSKIIGIGLNYRSHAEELGVSLPEVPVIFIKPSTAVIGPGEKILLPPQSRRVDYEAELGVVIGRVARNVSSQEAGAYIWGYTCANDVTARDLQPKNGQWSYSKGFDTFAPIGPWIETEIADPYSLEVVGLLNGKVVQWGKVRDLIFGIEELIAYITSCMTLLPGDVIFTGTPSGIGPLKKGDHFTVSIQGIGDLTNEVG